QLRCAQVVDEQVGQPARHPGEAERVPVGRPRRIEYLVEIRQLDFLLLVAVRGGEDGERGTAAGDGGNGNPLAGRVPRARRVDELQARKMRIGRGAGQLVDDSAVQRVGDEQVG